ncbi:hypothetical protein [Anaerovibrio sp.]|uniref:hypothetical protein n=1 Tax=Anaerovibrio sp. TaxID=1872532 RepID=UPI00388F60D8
MQIVYGLDINNLKYLVMDYNEAMMNGDTVRRLAAFRSGLGADRVVFMDMVHDTVIAIYNAEGHNMVPDLNDFKAARSISAGNHEREYHVTDYYLSTIVVEKTPIKAAC